jgi:signal recognition particle receptor subunit beta
MRDRDLFIHDVPGHVHAKLKWEAIIKDLTVKKLVMDILETHTIEVEESLPPNPLLKED